MAGKTNGRGGTGAKLPGKARHDSQVKPAKKHKHAASQATDIHTPLTEIRQKIRALEKLLAYDAEKSRSSQDSGKQYAARSMPSHIRQEKERALAGYKHDLQLALDKKAKTHKHSKMISKYHHVRFFERKKAERGLKRAKAALDRGEASEGAVLNARTDLNYTLYLPLDEKYISLWPQGKTDESDSVRTGDSWKRLATIWTEGLTNGLSEQEIEQAMLSIRDNGWPNRPGEPPAASSVKPERLLKHKATAADQTRRKGKANKGQDVDISMANDGLPYRGRKAGADEDDDSDGFFEK